jgi:hypothetical protein
MPFGPTQVGAILFVTQGVWGIARRSTSRRRSSPPRWPSLNTPPRLFCRRDYAELTGMKSHPLAPTRERLHRDLPVLGCVPSDACIK